MVINRLSLKIITVLLLLTTIFFAQEVRLSASKTHFSIDESIQLTFTFENIKNAPRSVNIDLHDYLKVVGGPYSSSNYSWVNGKVESTNSISYDVIAKKSGEIKIPEYEFEIKGQIYKTKPFTLHVSKVADPDDKDQGSRLPSTFIRLLLPKDSMYQGETFTIDYYLYTSESVVNISTNPQNTLEGFIVDRFKIHDVPDSRKEVINGREYLIAGIASLTLTATQTGEFVIPAKAFRISLKRQDRYSSFFDDPFFGTSTKDVNIYANPDTLTVFPLPGGAGPNYTGAIGDFAMHVSLDSTLIRENQASTLRIELIGHGNMSHFTFPELLFPGDFEVFEPKVKNNFKLEGQDYRGQRTWEYVLIPASKGKYQIEDIKFTYFSVQDRKFKTLSMPVPEIRVLSHDELEGDYSSGLSAEEVRLLTEDIRFLQLKESKLRDPDYDPLMDPRNRSGYILTLALLVLFITANWMLNLRDRNMRKIRYRNALKNIMLAYRSINEQMPAEQRLNIIEEGFLKYLEDKQLQPDAHSGIPDILKTIETYKYAPGLLSNQQLEVLKHKAIKVIEEIEGV